jgi:amino acid adenylation domain-containing protein
LWLLDQLESEKSTYNVTSGFRLAGALNADALERALGEIVRRHEPLRTNFLVRDGRPVQVVAERWSMELPIVDLTRWPAVELDAEVRRIAKNEARRPFDLSTDLMVRARLLRLNDTEHLLFLTLHHIAHDHWALQILYKELSILYRAFSTGSPSPLPELPIRYKDYAVWERQVFDAAALKEHLAYWKEQLRDSPPLSDLPTDYPRPRARTFRGARQALVLPKTLAHALKTLSKETEVTLFMILLAALNILLGRLTGRNDIVVGSPVAGRGRSETERLIGIFLNTVVFRTDLSGNPTFRELLARVRDVTLGAYDHQDLPFEKLLEELHLTRALSHTPLFQVFVNMYNFEDFHFGMDGLTVTRLEPEETISLFDLTLYIREQGDSTHLRVSYDADLFETGTITRLLGYYLALLEGIVADPDRAISRYRLFTPDQRRELAARRNVVGPANAFVKFKQKEIEQSIAARFERQARLYPRKAAVKGSEHQWSYDDLNGKANRIARTLVQSRGYGEERAALLFGHGAPMIAAILGVLKSAGSYVPLEPDHPLERIAYILEDSQAGVIITDRAHLRLARTLAKGTLPVVDIDEIDPATSTENLPVEVSPDALAYILYTSGSTGKPKGVMQNQRNVLHHIRCYTNSLHISCADKVTLFSSYGFDAAVMDIFGALLNGATLYPLDIREQQLPALRRRIAEEKLTIYHSTPTVFRYLCDGLSGRADLSTIRLVVLGGEEAQKADVDLFKKYFSKDCIFVNGLGPTESTLALQCFIGHESKPPERIVPVGYPVQDTEVLLLDEAGMEAEVYGEIGIRSKHVALGYWRRPELTRAAFFPHSQDGARRLYRTGDMGRLLPDGSILFLGRRDFQVKIRGYRIELGEIETALAGHPAVRETRVIQREDQIGDKQLAAYIVPRPEHSFTPIELRAFLKARLPDYMIPSAFMSLDSLPLTPNGKLDRAALPAPGRSGLELEETYPAPRTPVEEKISGIWREILKLERVGIHDDFFALGGHSLLATQVISRMCESFQVELSLRSLFEAPTVAGLAAQVAQARAQEAAPETTASVLAELESLSDEQAQLLLAQDSFRSR